MNLIQSSTIVSSAHRDAVETVAGLDDLNDGSPGEAEAPEDRPELAGLLAGDPLIVRARMSGYVQRLDPDAVLDAVVGSAEGGRETVVVEIPFGPGFFVATGLLIVRVWPARELGSEAEEEVYQAFHFGKERSFRQDFAFGLRQLSDIALKGLSPGVNDPTTAMQAMDRMEAIFVALGEKALPPCVREEEVDGTRVLVKVGRYGFDDVAGLAFDQIRRAAFTSGQVAVLERLLEILGRAIRANPLPERQKALWSRAFAVARLAPEQIPEDAANLVVRAVGVGSHLLRTELGVETDLEELVELSKDLRDGERVWKTVRTVLERSGL